jgi:protein-disulfide isomerase
MNRNILLGLAVLASLAGALVGALPAAAQSLPKPGEPLLAQSPIDPKALAPRREGDDMVMGLASAPVTIIEYASLTCPHCANFHANAFPDLKSSYIDKGLVRFVYRDFPLDRLALHGSMIARCAGPDRYFSFLDAFFKQQRSWALADQGQASAAMKRLAKLGGMPEDAFDACLKNQEVQNEVLTQRLRGEREFEVSSTPTLIINGQKHRGGATFQELEKVLKPLVGRS